MTVFYQKKIAGIRLQKWIGTNSSFPGDRFKYAYEAVTILHYRIGPDLLALGHVVWDAEECA
jgi:hypothetical protein